MLGLPDLYAIFSQALASGSKSTTLRPLGWLIVISVTGAISASRYGAQLWLVTALGIASAVAILLYLVAYVYFALTDPDYLRSEKYSIQKFAIEHGLVGDSSTGFYRLEGEKTIKSALPAPKTQTEQE